MPKIIQFTHPGQEHAPDDKKNGNFKEWNKSAHKRKFLKCQGEYVENGELNKGELIFWGEWEPPSKVERFSLSPNLAPQWLHTPVLPSIIPSPNQGFLQNTDPFIFGDTFKYFICKQYNKNGTNQLSKLEKGSLILFGSTHGKLRESSFFQLDTVFVVADYIEYNTHDVNALDEIKRIDYDYRNLVFKKAIPFGETPMKLRLYFGATYDNQIDGMYSFSPAKAWDNQNSGFPRLQLKDMEFITNNLNAAPKITETSPKDVKAFWEKIKALSIKHGCVEGVRFHYNKQNNTNEHH